MRLSRSAIACLVAGMLLVSGSSAAAESPDPTQFAASIQQIAKAEAARLVQAAPSTRKPKAQMIFLGALVGGVVGLVVGSTVFTRGEGSPGPVELYGSIAGFAVAGAIVGYKISK